MLASNMFGVLVISSASLNRGVGNCNWVGHYMSMFGELSANQFSSFSLLVIRLEVAYVKVFTGTSMMMEKISVELPVVV